MGKVPEKSNYRSSDSLANSSLAHTCTQHGSRDKYGASTLYARLVLTSSFLAVRLLERMAWLESSGT